MHFARVRFSGFLSKAVLTQRLEKEAENRREQRSDETLQRCDAEERCVPVNLNAMRLKENTFFLPTNLTKSVLFMDPLRSPFSPPPAVAVV